MSQQQRKKELENRLNRLAYEWRSGDKEQDEIVATYRSALEELIDSGLENLLDVDAELPDRYMPEAYLSLRRQFSLVVDEADRIVEFAVPPVREPAPRRRETRSTNGSARTKTFGHERTSGAVKRDTRKTGGPSMKTEARNDKKPKAK